MERLAALAVFAVPATNPEKAAKANMPEAEPINFVVLFMASS
jgi:hypothetical protein